MKLATSRSPEFVDSDRMTLLIPVGSTEQHGPHLPLATDTLIASAVAEALANRHDFVAVAPAICIGASGEHAGFPGTLSIGAAALEHLVIELVRQSFADWARIVLVNGHGGNAPALKAAAEVCSYEGRPIDIVHCSFPGADAHAGRTETSVMRYLHPELVRTDLIEPGNVTPVNELLPTMRVAGVRAVSPNGVLGDPTGSTTLEGEALFTQFVASISLR